MDFKAHRKRHLLILLYRKYRVVIRQKSADSYRAKNARLWIALRRSGIMLFTQPAAGEESCRDRILFIRYPV
ncbi:Uncharacterised protein [uncultured Roseburia sp.]|nr:Uncharacterised protein [uncultured Roseburia sp.]